MRCEGSWKLPIGRRLQLPTNWGGECVPRIGGWRAINSGPIRSYVALGANRLAGALRWVGQLQGRWVGWAAEAGPASRSKAWMEHLSREVLEIGEHRLGVGGAGRWAGGKWLSGTKGSWVSTRGLHRPIIQYYLRIQTNYIKSGW